MTSLIRHAQYVALTIAVCAAGCSASNPIGYQDPGPHDGGGGDNFAEPTGDAGAECRSELQPVSICPPNWALAQSMPFCSEIGGLPFDQLGHAGQYLVRVYGFGYGADTCFYSPYLDKSLVGIKFDADVSVYCNGTSLKIVWGEVTDDPFVNDLGNAPLCVQGADGGTGS